MSTASLPTSSSFSSAALPTGRISVDLRNSWNNVEDSNRRVLIVMDSQDAERKVQVDSAAKVATINQQADCARSSDDASGCVLYTLHVMSALLKSRSEYFRTMLASKFTEGRAHEDIRLTVSDASEGKALYLLLFSFYTNDVFEDSKREDDNSADEERATKAHAAAAAASVSALDEEETQQIDDSQCIRVKNEVVQRLTCKELLLLIRLADHYHALSIILPLALPVIRSLLATQLSFVAELYDLPEAILQQEPARPLAALIASKVFDYFRVFWKWTWSANRPLWVSLSPSAVAELLSSQDLQVENEATVMDAVRVWMDERWKEVGGMKSAAAVDRMLARSTVATHSAILKKVQWLQLPRLYLLHVVLPLFESGRTFSHVPLFRYLIFDLLSLALTNPAPNLSSLPACFCAQEQCFRCLYPSMNGPRQRTTLSYCLAFSGVSVLQAASASAQAKCESLMQHSMGVQLQLCLSLNEQRRFCFQFRVRSAEQAPHYVLEMKLRVNMWNYLKNAYEPLQSQPFTVKTGQSFEAFAGDGTEAARAVAGKTAEDLISDGIYVKYGGMNVKMQITHTTS